MEGYKSFTQAVDEAALYASCWRGVSDGTVFSYQDMMGIALVLDMTAPLEEPFWYLVLPTGEIDLLCPQDRTAEQLFLAIDPTPVPAEERARFTGEDDLPDDLLIDGTVPVAPSPAPSARRFCKYCGAPTDADSVFCQSCGKKL